MVPFPEYLMKSITVVHQLAPALALALVAGCSTTTTSTGGAVVVDGRPDYGGSSAPPAATSPTPAPLPPDAEVPYAGLVSRAEGARSAGDYEQALALLERAQRIDPDSAAIYLALAETHRARGDQSQARATAERGLLYCTSRTQCDALRAYTK
jgi:tetratricopeptide (TPR) repeat protein